MSKFITLHILNDISWSNLNRDDSGAPKRTFLGGVERGMLSSQSIKRAARKDYESRIIEIKPTDLADSYRSRNLHEIVVDRAKTLLSEEEFDAKKLEKRATKYIKSLTGKNADGKETITWLSLEEIETLASIIADDEVAEEVDKLGSNETFSLFMNERGKTGSLAIAAFGRMFANATKFQTEAAISVSPAISTHRSLIETDYFISADDWISHEDEGAGAGAGHLGVALYTSGVFYRTLTIDVDELWANWTGKNSEFAEAQLTQFLKSLVYALPTGKKNHTAPYSEPILVVAEEQNYRQAYSISGAIVNPDDTGFVKQSVENLARQFDVAREISGSNYGRSITTGTFKDTFSANTETGSVENLVETILEWLNIQKPEEIAVAEEIEEDVVAISEDPTEDPESY